MSTSPVNKVDSYITEFLSDKDVSQKFSKWSDLYESHYKDLDDLRDKILKGVSIDINRYIDAQAQIYNPFLIEAIQNLLPLHSDLESGVVIKQNILERTKVEYKKAGLVHLPLYTGLIQDMWDLSKSVYVDPYVGILDDEPDITIPIVTPTLGELQIPDEFFDYSVDYLKVTEENIENWPYENYSIS